MNGTTYKYFNAAVIEHSQKLQLSGLPEFCRFLQSHHCKSVFVLKDAAGATTHFAAFHEGLLVQQPAEGFRCLEDVRPAAAYPDAASYYEAQTLQCKSYEDYVLLKEAGVTDPDLVSAMRATGFVQGFTQWEVAAKWHALLPDGVSIRNSHDLYQWAKSGGFDDFTIFSQALKAGFINAIEYNLAVGKGYDNAVDFGAGEAGLFGNAAEWKAAQKQGIDSRAEWEQWRELELLPSELAHDERLLLVLLSKLPEKKKVSLKKLGELFEEELKTYKKEDGRLPSWFRATPDSSQAFPKFLETNSNARVYGTYDPDGEYFETTRLQTRKVIVDGSNVAHNSNGNSRSKPVVANIMRLVAELKGLGFSDIVVIADASLRHRLEDADRLPELKDQVSYMEAPAETTADAFLIEYVKKERCLLVSNDTFRDWKVYDPWIAQYIDFYRLSFVIKDDLVLLPHFEKAGVGAGS
ncbi:MAG: hypothetical protein JWP69_1262 [Flaviaesturariibacter sp.]|nr:hypothetical protein [Flaviaesturariibacter sp.]